MQKPAPVVKAQNSFNFAALEGMSDVMDEDLDNLESDECSDPEEDVTYPTISKHINLFSSHTS